MRNIFAILRQLSDREFRSGTDLAAALGVSRGTVHNAVCEARVRGVVIYSVTGRGYRLARPIAWLDRGQLAAAASGYAIRVADAVESTNVELMRACRANAAHKSVLAVEWQSGGRGRRGRAWLAAPGSALLFSLLWRFGRPLAALSGLSLVVGLAVVRVLRRQGVTEAGLKWPNDLIWRGGKLGGLLIDLEGDMQSPANAVIGVGLNMRLPATVKAAIDQPAAALDDALAETDRNTLLAAILRELGDCLARFEQDGFAAFRHEWESVHLHQDAAVRILRGEGEQLSGIARGVDANGALRLETPAGIEVLHAGEVRLRPVS